MPTIKEWFKKNAKGYSSAEKAMCACMRDLSKKRDSVIRVAKHYFDVEPIKKGKAILPSVLLDKDIIKKKSDVGISEEDLRSKHDVLYQIRQAVKQLEPGVFLTEQEFRECIAKVGSKFRSKSDMPEFDKYKGKVGDRVYWGHSTSIAKMKSEGILQ